MVLICMFLARPCFGHGGVAFEEDACVIRIGFLQAHFALFQPTVSGSEEFCEDIPAVAESVFVLNYLTDFLREMPVSFRIIEDVENIGVYANWSDIQSLQDIEQSTVFYRPPVIEPSGVLTVGYVFTNPGSYIGIVTAQHPLEDKSYHAVFHFQVGGSTFGYTPYFIGAIVLLQLLYWFTSGGLNRFIVRIKKGAHA